VAEVVERAAMAKVAVVAADERERDTGGGRITLNLGHSLGHAVEAAAGYGGLLHGEAVAYGLRAACAIGIAVGVTPPERADRITGLLDALALGVEPLPYRLETVLDHLAADKKHAGGRLRWVLPTADGVVVRDDIPPDVVATAAGRLLTTEVPA
jgi:3-dehydroquinate synthase